MSKKIFNRLVVANFIKNLTLSITGMIDCAIVGQFILDGGLAAMELALPIFIVFAAISLILGTGLSVSVSGLLAKGEKEDANKVVNSVISVTFLVAIVFMILGALCPEAVMRLLAGRKVDDTILKLATDYLRPILLFAIPILFYDVVSSIALLEGADQYIKYSSWAIFIVDIIGDLVAVRCGFGMSGVAYASGIAYLAAMMAVLVFFLQKKSMFTFSVIHLHFKFFGPALKLGFPMGLEQLCEIVWTIVLNRFMLMFAGNLGLSALSVQEAVHYFPESLSLGIGAAVLILVGIYGAENDDTTLERVRNYALKWCVIAGGVMAIVLFVLAPTVLWIFTEDAQIHESGVFALRVYLIGVPFLSFNRAVCSYQQGLGKTQEANRHIILNCLVLPIILAFVMGRFWGEKGIFASLAACQVLMAFIFLIDLMDSRRKGEDLLKSEPAFGEIRAELRLGVETVEGASDASKEIYECCLNNNVSKKDAYNIALCAEELLVNTLNHGFSDGKKHNVGLRLIIGENDLLLRLRDDCNKFDLVERYNMFTPEDPTSNIGLRLVFAGADEVNYSSVLDLNNTSIRISLK